MNRFSVLAILLGGLGAASTLFGQVAISTHSGLIQFTSGTVYLGDQPVHKSTTNLISVKNGETLRTGEDANAEVLLTPGVFLRLGSDTAIRMDSNDLSDTRLTLLAGTAMLETDELLQDNSVVVMVGNQPVEFRKKGLFRMSAQPPVVAAINGDAFVAGDVNTTVKHGKELNLDAAAPQLSAFHIDKKRDGLYQFSDARAADSAYATGVTASSLYYSGFDCMGSSWYLMGAVGMYSYLPCGGIMSSPFGYNFLGMNYGYLWGGPYYYIPPAGLFVPVSGTTVAGGTGAAGGATAQVPVVPPTPIVRPGGRKPYTPQVPVTTAGATPTVRPSALTGRSLSVPVFVGPGYAGMAPHITYQPGAAGFMGGGGRAQVTESRALMNMAGPAFASHVLSGAARGSGSGFAGGRVTMSGGAGGFRGASRGVYAGSRGGLSGGRGTMAGSGPSSSSGPSGGMSRGTMSGGRVSGGGMPSGGVSGGGHSGGTSAGHGK